MALQGQRFLHSGTPSGDDNMRKHLALMCMLAAMGFPLSAAADIPLLQFCLGAPPADPARLDYYNSTCPSVIALAEQQGQDSAAATAAKAQADLEAVQLANLAKAFPTQTPAAAKDVDIAGFKHFAEFRQAALLRMAGGKMAAAIKKYYTPAPANEGAPANPTPDSSPVVITRLVSPSDVAILRAHTLPVSILTEEIDRYNEDVIAQSNACIAEKSKTKPGAPEQRISMTGGVVAADALLGFSIKLSQAFQTNLGDTEAAPFSTGANAVLSASLVSGWDHKIRMLYMGLPMITDANEVVHKLKRLRLGSDNLLGHMSATPDKSTCRTAGKALLEDIRTRLVELSKTPDAATPSPMLTTMRWAQLSLPEDTDKNKSITRFLIVDALHSGGSVAATKTSFTSQRTTALATVMVFYRLETIDAQVLTAGVLTCPGNTDELDSVRYTKTFKPDPKFTSKDTCS